ncbi:uncharacterized protein LOC106153410 [Lingula anatina]|uniref:Uncharacterized protein LOC106153410 n=1 Tax=Lingula anatina TaxID=7574 RepID=A0A1S3HCA8_LINAN|nr:uncharacterized protein LOC106153410 [Lingula anatina]|eukprot:XP_013382789.1 uncharacterized protein LOC106153410 [Lingula anatina]
MTTSNAHIPSAAVTAAVVGQHSAHQHQHRKVPHRHLVTYPWQRPGRLHANRTPGPTLSRRGRAPHTPSSSSASSQLHNRVSSVKSLQPLRSISARRRRRSPSRRQTGGGEQVDFTRNPLLEDGRRSHGVNEATGIYSARTANIDPDFNSEYSTSVLSRHEGRGDVNHNTNNTDGSDRPTLGTQHHGGTGNAGYEITHNNVGEIDRYTKECDQTYFNQNGKPRTPGLNIQSILEHCISSKKDSLRHLASQQADSGQLLRAPAVRKGGGIGGEKRKNTASHGTTAAKATERMIECDGDAEGVGGGVDASARVRSPDSAAKPTATVSCATREEEERRVEQEKNAIEAAMKTGSAESEGTLLSMHSCPEATTGQAEKPPRYHRRRKKKTPSSERRCPPRKQNIWSRLSVEAQCAMTQTMEAMELDDKDDRNYTDRQTVENTNRDDENNQNSLERFEKGQYYNESAKVGTQRENPAVSDEQTIGVNNNSDGNALRATKEQPYANVDFVQKNIQSKRRHKSETESNTSGETPVTSRQRNNSFGYNGREHKKPQGAPKQVVHWKEYNDGNNNKSRNKSARTKLPKIGSDSKLSQQVKTDSGPDFSQEADDYYNNEFAAVLPTRRRERQEAFDDDYYSPSFTQHAIPGVGNFTVPRYHFREKTFEITPAGYDSRYQYTHKYNPEEDDPINPKVFSHSVKKCSDWLTKCLPAADDPNVSGTKLKLSQSSHF